MVYTYYDYLDNYYDYYEVEYEQPYNMDVLNPPLFTLSILCAVFSLIFVTYFCYRLYVCRKILSKTSVCITSFCLICHLLLNLSDPIGYYLWYIQYNPNTNYHWDVNLIWDAMWLLSKISLYAVFIHRYYMIYNASTLYQNIKRMKYIIFTLFTIIICIQTILILLYMIYYYSFINGDYGTKQESNAAKRKYLDFLWTFLFLDIAIILFIGYLLIRSIIKIIITLDKDSTMWTVKRRVSLKTKKSINNIELTVSVTITPPSPKYQRDKENDNISMVTNNNDQQKDQMLLLHTVTRICITCIIALTSTFIYQLIWLIAEEIEHAVLYWIQYTWCIDSVINILCIYLSMTLGTKSKKHYKYCCNNKLCKCHQCCLKCVIKIVECHAKLC